MNSFLISLISSSIISCECLSHTPRFRPQTQQPTHRNKHNKRYKKINFSHLIKEKPFSFFSLFFFVIISLFI